MSVVSSDLDTPPVAPPGRPGIDRPWQFEDVSNLPEPFRYEIVDGGLLTVPPPGPLHRWLAQELYDQLHRQAPPAWRATYGEPVPTGETDYRVADLTVTRRRPRPRVSDVINPAADVGLLVEVTLTSYKNDRVLKPVEYAGAGIPHFWRLEAEPGFVLVAHELRGDRYVETGRWSEGRITPSAPFPLIVDLDALRGDDA